MSGLPMKRIHDGPAATAPWSIETTLLELVAAVQDVSRSDDEVVSVVSRMVNSGRFVLRGIFAGSRFKREHYGRARLNPGKEE
jgi:hypothetical protein